MFEVAVEAYVYEGSTEPTDVVGNEGSMAAENGDDGVALLVVEWQAMSEGRERKVLADRILGSLWPAIRDAVSGFKGTGSVSTEDLEQVGAIAVFKLMQTYRHDLRASTTFEQTAKARVRSRCADAFRRTAHVVNVSDWAQRSRKTVNGVDTAPQKPKNSVKLQIDRPDAEDRGFSFPEHEATKTPEQLLSDAQTRQRMLNALSQMDQKRRAVIVNAFGIGRDTVSSDRALGVRLNTSEGKVSAVLEEALRELRAVMRCL